LITTTPSARIQSIGQEQFMPDELQSEFNKVTKDTVANFLKTNGFCPQPQPNEIVYAINTRLNPSSTYTVKFTPKDIYGNTLSAITKTFTTGKMKDKDKFLYIGYPEKNTIPSNVPLLVNVQSINTDTANIAVCGMSVEQYLQNKNTNVAYDASGNQIASAAKCDESFAKDVPLKNTNWILSNTRIDLEKDIGGKSLSSPIIRIVGGLRTTDPIAKKR